MDLKQRFQQDMRNAIRMQDKQRVHVIRRIFAAFENAQEAIGKQAFESSDPDGNNIPPDRQQVLSEQTMQAIIRNGMQKRREAADIFRTVGQTERAEREETEIAILAYYLTTVQG